MNRKTIADIEAKTQDAYSRDRYTSWPRCIAALLKAGYSPEHTVAILLSKWARWAADGSGKPYGHATANDLLKGIGKPTVAELDELL